MLKADGQLPDVLSGPPDGIDISLEQADRRWVPEGRNPSAEYEDAGGDKGEGKCDAGGEQHVFLREIGCSVGASDAIRSVGCGLEFHIVFPLMRRICDASPVPLW